MRWKLDGRDLDWLHAGFSKRSGGVSSTYGDHSLNLGWTKEDPAENVAENRRRWVQEIWGDGGQSLSRTPEDLAQHPEVVTLAQVHSADSHVVSRGGALRPDAAGRAPLRGDGLLTSDPEILLGIQTADCVPVLVADVRRRAVAAFHAGWRGTVERIVERGVEQMKREFGTRPEDLRAAVGPAIGACCYRVGGEVCDRFAAEFSYAEELFSRSAEPPRWELADESQRGPGSGELSPTREEGLFLDLAESNRRQLASAGVSMEAIDMLADCTACSRTTQGGRRYFSYRAEHGRTGRMMALIGVRTLR